MKDETSSFLCGYAAYLDFIFCAKELDSNDDGMPFAFFLLDGEEWEKFSITFSWAHVAVASIKPQGRNRAIVSMGAHGEYYECVYDAVTGLPTQQVGVIPSDRPFLGRNLAIVEETIFAVGMGRVVARWEGPGMWTRLDPKEPLPEGIACGFNDLTGPSLKEMYAVGWRGEIWCMNNAVWHQVDSPLSAHLRAACTLPDGSIVAVGYNGAMVRGRHDTWRVVDSGRAETLLDVCCFDGKVFVATAYKILVLNESGLMPVTDFEDPADMPASCGGLYLSDDGAGIISMGPSDLFRLRDGIWKRIS